MLFTSPVRDFDVMDDRCTSVIGKYIRNISLLTSEHSEQIFILIMTWKFLKGTFLQEKIWCYIYIYQTFLQLPCIHIFTKD